MTSFSAVAAPIWTKFGRLMLNKMQITGKWSRSKQEAEFQYGERLFFQTRSSSTLLIYFDLLRAKTPTNTKTGIVLSGRDRHLEKSI